MADPREVAVERPSLFSWAAGSFHAALLVAVLVAVLHLSGAAGDLLGGVGTLPGAVVYCYLWALSAWTTDRALAASGVTPAAGVPDRRGALRAAAAWGGVTGVLFFAALFAVAAGLLVAAAGVEAIGFLLVAGVIAAMLAAAVGAVVGVALALLDVALLRAAVALTGDRRGADADVGRATDADSG